MPLGDFVYLNRVGLKAGWTAQTLVHRGSHRQIGIHPYQIHESERTHPKTHRFHQTIQVLGLNPSFAHNAQALCIVRPGDPVDDKTRGILRMNHDFAHSLCQGMHPLSHIRLGHRPSNHFHQFHDRGGIKKMQTDHPLGSGQALGKLLHRDG